MLDQEGAVVRRCLKCLMNQLWQMMPYDWLDLSGENWTT